MLILVRHGRTGANLAGLLQGHIDNPLDAVGRTQARAVGVALAPVLAKISIGEARIVTSPLLRARQTAEEMIDAHTASPQERLRMGSEIQVSPAWIEMSYGEWEGRPVADVPTATWAQWRADDTFAPPGGESIRAIGQRVREACAALQDEAAERDVIIVSHVGAIKAAVAWALGVDDGVTWRMRVDQASVHRIGLGRFGPTLLSLNAT